MRARSCVRRNTGGGAGIEAAERGSQRRAAAIKAFGVDLHRRILAGGTLDPSQEVDRLFLFLVRDVPTGAILFMGRVMDPSVR